MSACGDSDHSAAAQKVQGEIKGDAPAGGKFAIVCRSKLRRVSYIGIRGRPLWSRVRTKPHDEHSYNRPLYTAVAHEVERWTYNPQVDGSIPSGSTNSPWTRRFCAMKSDWVGSPERSRSSPDCLIAGMRIIQKRGIFLRGNYVSANNMGQSHPALREDTSGDGDDFLEEPKGCKTPLPP